MTSAPQIFSQWPVHVQLRAFADIPGDNSNVVAFPGSSFPTPAIGDVPREAFVPPENIPANPLDELCNFRIARDPLKDSFLFAARVQVKTVDERFPVGALVIFDSQAQPTSGDIVCAECQVQEKPDSRLTECLAWLSFRSLRLERLLDRFNLPRYQPTIRTYLFRRYIDDGAKFRLETLDGTGLASTNSETVFVQPLGVATPLRPWGVHRDVAML